ncbi:helicase-like protein [Breznakia blatticola]|uniref:Helicase-like protein n=1 Tax=Breznakia blatticola TaxID=1754012 RepID=A0A4R7Z858_9FIRM|nr:SNF2-related protein [Breznakia blatticola]TDW08368.1 helicase-like protein [Breznakia blatticola]
MYLSDDLIKSVVKKPGNFNWAKRHQGEDDLFLAYDVLPGETGQDILATVLYQGYESDVKIRLDALDHIESHYCNCRFHSPSSGCGHVGLALFKYRNEYQTPDPIISSSKVNTSTQQVNSLNEKREAIMRQKELRRKEIQASYYVQESLEFLQQMQEKEKNSLISTYDNHVYHLEFEFERQENYYYYRYANNYMLSAKIGYEKMYVLKSFQQFIRNLHEENFVKYGKFLAFTHHMNSFDEASQQAIEFIERFIKESTYASDDRYLAIDEKNIDAFFDTFQELSQLINIQFAEEDFIVDVDVLSLGDYYLLSLQDGNIHDYLEGSQHYYQFEKQVLKRFVVRDDKMVHEFIKKIMYDQFYIHKDDLQNTISYLLSVFENTVVFHGVDIDQSYEDRISLYADIQDENLVVKVLLNWEDGYAKSLFDQDNRAISHNANNLKFVLESYGFKKQEGMKEVIKSFHDQDAIFFIEQVLPSLKDYAEVFVSDAIKNFDKTKSVGIQVGVRIENNLLSIDLDSINCKPDELKDILKAYRKKRKFHRLKNGEIISLEGESIAEFDQMMEDMHMDVRDIDTTMQVPVHYAFQMDDAIHNFKQITGKEEQSFQDFLHSFDDIDASKLQIHPKYEKILKDYQKHGVRWMMLLSMYGLGGILADDMGLGKTIQAIALLETNHEVGKRSIIVTPASLMLNWQDELEKFDSSLSYLCIYGDMQTRKEMIETIDSYDVIITTYDYLKRDIEAYEQKQFDYVIIDEAQYIKNQTTKAAKSVKRLKSRVRFALTGTPIENSLAELWSIFDYLMPTYLYNYRYFKANYESPIVLENDEKKRAILKRRIEPFLLRRRKEEVLKELPSKIEKNLRFNFDAEEEKLYVAKLSQVNDDLQAFAQSEDNHQIEILKLLMQLRQICCEPRMLFDNIDHASRKLRGCMEIVESLKESKQKVLIFSSFTTILDFIAEELNMRNFTYLKLTGEVNKTKRKELVEKFQGGEADIFLISLKAGGVGLNLTNAQAVIHYDPWWNLSAQNQATDRAHRIGQEHEVTVFNLIMKNSIEERILELQAKKKEIADTFVENSEGSITKMSASDIMELLKRDNS